MAAHVQDYEKICVVIPSADLAGDESRSVRDAVSETVEHRQLIDFIIDLTNVGFIDSAGLETLLWIKRKTDELFGQVKLINLDANVRKILEITRLEPRFEMHPDLATALKMMR
ncbi:MAG: STAS domain-containing protein [Tepidisphaeraceae bacterium]